MYICSLSTVVRVVWSTFSWPSVPSIQCNQSSYSIRLEKLVEREVFLTLQGSWRAESTRYWWIPVALLQYGNLGTYDITALSSHSSAAVRCPPLRWRDVPRWLGQRLRHESRTDHQTLIDVYTYYCDCSVFRHRHKSVVHYIVRSSLSQRR